MDGEETPSSSGTQLEQWAEEQDQLKKKLIIYDDFPWRLPSSMELSHESEMLKYIGGVDISFSKEDSSVACACLVVLELPSLHVVHHEISLLRLHVPYIPGFLAFREAPILLQLLKKMKDDQHPFYPQVVMVDGNGLLHPRGFGVACHLGVLAHLPTIGVGKNLHHVDGLNQAEVRQSFQHKENQNEQVITLVGNSGFTWGVGFRPTLSTLKPVYVSVGHRISLDSAVEIVKMTCKYRVPEPIRQADMRSRAYLQKHQLELGRLEKGMAYVHERNFIHRDRKSDNLLISTLSRIADFGNDTRDWNLQMDGTNMTAVQAPFAVVNRGVRPTVPADCLTVLGEIMTRCWDADSEKG